MIDARGQCWSFSIFAHLDGMHPEQLRRLRACDSDDVSKPDHVEDGDTMAIGTTIDVWHWLIVIVYSWRAKCRSYLVLREVIFVTPS